MLRRRFSCGRLNLIATLHSLGWTIDDPVRTGKSSDDLGAVPKVPANLDGFHLHLVVGAEHGDLHPLIAWHQRRRWHAHYLRVPRELKLYLAVSASEELAVGIIGLQLNQHAARGWVHRMRHRYQDGVEWLAGILRHLQSRLQPRM